MRISELLGKPAYDEAGNRLGVVHDVRAEQVAPLGQRGALRVCGVVIGRGSLGVRLGYGSSELPGPLLLRLLFARRASSAKYVPWEHARVEPGRLVVAAPVETLPHPSDTESIT